MNVTVTGGTSMKPGELSVHQNDTVTINLTSDTDGEVHLYGYNIAFDCGLGAPGSDLGGGGRSPQ